MPSEFAISEAPVAGESIGGPSGPSGPSVGTFPSTSIPGANVKLRFFEPHAPTAINSRWVGMPRGVYMGFIPSIAAGSRVLRLLVDPSSGFSLLKVSSGGNESALVDLFTVETVELDLTGHVIFPVNVLASANYSSSRTGTNAKIFTRASGPAGKHEVLICRLSLVGDNIVASTTVPTEREPPVAFQGQSYGYMPGGSIDDLAAANVAGTEVIAARTSPYTGGHASLGARLDSDLSSVEMADRLALRSALILSNVHESRSGTTINVSASFTQTGRSYSPVMTLSDGGSTSVEGAVTSASNNVCFIVDADTGARLIDSITRLPVFGALTYSSATLAGATISFTASSSFVTSSDSPFQFPLQEGDILEGPDGLYYELLDFLDANNAVLGSPYQGQTDDIVDPSYRRFTLQLDTSAGGFGGISATDIQFTFPAFIRVDRPYFDGSLFIKKDGEQPPEPLATQSSVGKALLAVSGGLVGSFRTIKNSGTIIANDIHTVNFVNGGAVASATPGVADVVVNGPTGPDGPAANVGPTGAIGPPAPGWLFNVPFEPGSTVPRSVAVPGDATVTDVIDFSLSVTPLSSMKFVYAGLYHLNGIQPLRHHRIDAVTITGPTTVSITTFVENQAVTPAVGSTIGAYVGASE